MQETVCIKNDLRRSHGFDPQDFHQQRRKVLLHLQCWIRWSIQAFSNSQLSFSVHIRKATKFDDVQFDQFFFPQCNQRFISQEILNNHVQQKHPVGDDRPFSCELCAATFKTKNHMGAHLTLFHSSGDRKFVCELCKKPHAAQYILNAHMRNRHSDVKRIACNYCGLKFRWVSGMKKHCVKDHGTDCPYPCSICGQKVNTLNELKRHKMDQHGVNMNVQKYNDEWLHNKSRLKY